MLSGFVNNRHTVFGVHLPFIMMAYQSSVHETKGRKPNMMTFERETATHLNIQCEMSSQIKQTFSNKWKWELQDCLENAYAFVRKKMNKSMARENH